MRRAGTHAVDGGGEHGGGLGLGGLQEGADLHQVLQGGELGGGAALGVAAVGEDLAGDLLRQEAEGAGEEGALLRDGDGGGDQALQGGERAGVQLLGREGGGEVAGVVDQPGHQALAEGVVGRGGEEIVMAEPGGEPGADDVRAVGNGVERGAGHPIADELAGAGPGGVGAEGAQVAQPDEAMCGGAQDGRAAGIGPAAEAQAEGGAREFELALEDVLAASWHRPATGRGRVTSRGVRHAADPQMGQAREGAACVAQPPCAPGQLCHRDDGRQGAASIGKQWGWGGWHNVSSSVRGECNTSEGHRRMNRAAKNPSIPPRSCHNPGCVFRHPSAVRAAGKKSQFVWLRTDRGGDLRLARWRDVGRLLPAAGSIRRR